WINPWLLCGSRHKLRHADRAVVAFGVWLVITRTRNKRVKQIAGNVISSGCFSRERAKIIVRHLIDFVLSWRVAERINVPARILELRSWTCRWCAHLICRTPGGRVAPLC